MPKVGSGVSPGVPQPAANVGAVPQPPLPMPMAPPAASPAPFVAEPNGTTTPSQTQPFPPMQPMQQAPTPLIPRTPPPSQPLINDTAAPSQTPIASVTPPALPPAPVAPPAMMPIAAPPKYSEMAAMPQQAPYVAPQATPVEVLAAQVAAQVASQVVAAASQAPPIAAPAMPGVPDLATIMGQAASGSGNPLTGLDMSGVSDSSFRPIPEDLTYEAEIKDATLGRSTNGNLMLTLRLVTIFPVPHTNVAIMDYVTLTDAAMWRFKSLCRACELLSEDGKRFIGQSEKDFIGYAVRFNIRHDLYEGTVRNKINGAYSEAYEASGLSGGGGGAIPTSPSTTPATPPNWQ